MKTNFDKPTLTQAILNTFVFGLLGTLVLFIAIQFIIAVNDGSWIASFAIK